VGYSFAFEIYTWKQDWGELKERFQEKMNTPSDFLQIASADSVRDDSIIEHTQ
jgi:hypothetical protein